MKRIILFSVLFLGTLVTSKAASFEEVMSDNIKKMYSSKTSDEFTDVANQFERIAAKESKQWLPNYYATYSYVLLTYFEQALSPDQKNKILDKAQQLLDLLEKDFFQESEVFALQGLVYQLRIQDSSTAYQFSRLSTEALNKAEKLNPKNPRVYYLMGCNLFYTPEQYGGGPAKAQPLLEKAMQLFESQNSDNQLLPTWGKEHCLILNKQCLKN